MSIFLNDYDFERTIRDYEFTRKARSRIREMVSSESFLDMSGDEILRFLLDRMEIVPFRDHLKRYLYKHAGIRDDFRSVPDKVWQKTIEYAFEENHAPHSFGPSSTRWSATVRNWLNADRVRRSTVFLLGFGLRMPPEAVSEWLTKVLKEDDFRLDDPEELVYGYCFAHGLPYARAHAWLEQYAALPESVRGKRSAAGYFPGDDRQLESCLRALKADRRHLENEERKTHCFRELYGRSREKIAAVYNRDEEEKPAKERRRWTAEDVSPADLEQMLCSGIPVTASGNLTKASQSLLNRHFESFRPSRQHIDGILKGQLHPDRYDLLTLSFFVHSWDEGGSEERLQVFLEETNNLLHSCQMGNLYPVHPYEAFLLICILSDFPLPLYAEVWESSYGLGEN